MQGCFALPCLFLPEAYQHCCRQHILISVTGAPMHCNNLHSCLLCSIQLCPSCSQCSDKPNSMIAYPAASTSSWIFLLSLIFADIVPAGAHICGVAFLRADVTIISICRERGRSGSSSGGLGGAGGGGQSELQLQRQRVITRRKALQRKLSEVRQSTAGCALVSDADQPQIRADGKNGRCG